MILLHPFMGVYKCVFLLMCQNDVNKIKIIKITTKTPLFHIKWKKPFVSSNPIILVHLSITAILKLMMCGQLGRKC